MSFLSGLFGRTKYEPTTKTVQTVSKLPDEIAPYVTDILTDAQAQYDKAVAEGYQPYGQETIAPRTQEELDAMAGLRGLIGGQGQYIDEAEAALRGIDTEFTAEAAQKFMSPYQQAVTDIEKRKAEEDFRRRVMPEFERQAIEAGGMSGLGSRAGVQAALLGEAFSQQLGDIQAKGQQKAYEDAYRQFTDQGQRQRMQAEDLRNVGLQRFQTGLAEQGLGQQLAQQDRQEAQNILDKKFLEYLEQEQYPAQKLAEYSGLVYGNPLAKMADTTSTTSGFRAPNAPGIGQQLLGLGLSGLNVFGMGGGFGGGFSANKLFQGPGGSTRSVLKTGGRIVYRQEGGEVPNVYSQGQQVGSGLSQLASPFFSPFRRGIFPRPRQTNVIENIDNAAGSLNDYKEAMDENMLNLSKASSSISRTYNQTFGNPLRFLMGQRGTPIRASQSPGFGIINELEKGDTFGMKAGGGLGSLPVIKQQAGSDPRTRRALARRGGLQQVAQAPVMGRRAARKQARQQKVDDQNFLDTYLKQFSSTTDFNYTPRTASQAAGLVDMYGTNTQMNTPVSLQRRQQTADTFPGGLAGIKKLRDKLTGRLATGVDTLDDDKPTLADMGMDAEEKRKFLEDKSSELRGAEEKLMSDEEGMLEGFTKEQKEANEAYRKKEEKRIKQLQGWPGDAIADAIDQGLKETSVVQMLSKVMNTTVKGVTKRNKEVSKLMSDLDKTMLDKDNELRNQKREDKVATFNKKAKLTTDKILDKYNIREAIDKLPMQRRQQLETMLATIANRKESDLKTSASVLKVLNDFIEEVEGGGTKSGAPRSVTGYVDQIRKDIAQEEGYLYDEQTKEIKVSDNQYLSADQAKAVQLKIEARKKKFTDILSNLDPSMSKTAALNRAYLSLSRPTQQSSPPADYPNARLAPDGNYYIPDPNNPGGFMKVQ